MTKSIRPLHFVIAVVLTTGIAVSSYFAYAQDERKLNPLKLPCTIGTIATTTNPYSKKVEKYKCEKCGSETCWIVQSN